MMKKLIKIFLLVMIFLNFINKPMLLAEENEVQTGETVETVETIDPMETTYPVEITDPVETSTPMDTSDPIETSSPMETLNPSPLTTQETVIEEIDEGSKDDILKEDFTDEILWDEEELIEQALNDLNLKYQEEKAINLSVEDVLKVVNGEVVPFTKSRMMYRSIEEEVKAYLHNFEIVKQYDGTAPFDNDDNAGNDSNYENKIVRSFDKVVYRTSYSTLSENVLDTSMSGTFYFKAKLPVSAGIASFDLKAMEWLENVSIQELENESILEGQINLKNQIVSPRVGTINWVISINQALNGTVIDSPTFYMKLNDGEYMVTKGEPIKVSAKANINSKINYEGMYENKPLFSILLELVASTEGKGIKGQEIINPHEPIKFTLKSNTNQNILEYKVNNEQGLSIIKNGVIGKNIPLSGNNVSAFNQVFNSGNITINNNQVNIDAFNFDSLYNKVTNNANKINDMAGYDYNDDHYPFGAYVFITDKPYVIDNNQIYSMEIQSLTAKSFLNEELVETNLSDNTATYLLGKPEGGGPGTAGGPAQFLTVNVINPTTKEKFTLIDKDSSRNIPPDYSVYPGELVQIDQGAMQYKSNNRAYIKQYYGLIKFDTNIFEALNNDEEFSHPVPNKNLKDLAFYWVGKSDKNGWVNEEEMYNAHINDVKNQNGYVLFDSADEAKENGYVVVGFLSLCEFVKPDYVITWDAYGTYPAVKVKKDALMDKSTDSIYPKDSPKRVGVILGELEGIDFDGNVYKRENIYQSLGDDLDMYGNIKDIRLGFIKAQYDANGILKSTSLSNAIGNRNGNWTHAASLVGGSFYVKEYNTYINEHISQRIANNEYKEVYNLDKAQYNVYIDFETGTTLNTKTNITDDFIITQTIPDTIKPFKETGSVEEKWNIVYDGDIVQDLSLTDGVKIENYANSLTSSKTYLEVMKEINKTSDFRYEVSEKTEGNQTIITWKIYDYPVSYKLPKIHLTGKISENVENNHHMEIIGEIKSAYAPKINRDSVGIKTIRIGGATINKIAVPEIRVDDAIGFKIEFKNDALISNESENIDALSVDILPFDNEDNPGLDLGEYYLDNIIMKAKLTDSNPNDESIPDLRLYYSTQKQEKFVILENNRLIDLETKGFKYIDLNLNLKDDRYILDDNVSKQIKEIFNKQKITALGILSKNVGNNSTYSFEYKYNWDDMEFKRRVESWEFVFNRVDLAVASTTNQHTYDTAVSSPFISKEITKINDLTSNEINGLNNHKVKDNDEIEYKINFFNPYNDESRIVIKDEIPLGTTLILSSLSDNGYYNRTDNTVEWVFDNVKPHSKNAVSFKVKVINDDTKEIINQAKVKYNDNPYVDTNVITNPKQLISAVKSSNPASGTTVKENELIEYFITVKNTGIVDVENILIKDQIPHHTTFVEVKNNGEYLKNDNAVKFNIPLLKPDEEIKVSFVVKVNKLDKAINIENIAEYGINTIDKKTNKVIHPTKIEVKPDVFHYEIVNTANSTTLGIYIITIIAGMIGTYLLNKD